MKILIAILLIISPILHARIGETLPECRIRYGMETKTAPEPSTIRFFEKSGFTIGIVFRDEKAASLIISKTGADPAEITPVQINTIITSNACGSTWKPAPDSSDETTHWITEDGKIQAFYTASTHYLVIITTAEKNRNLDAQAEKEKAEVSGF